MLKKCCLAVRSNGDNQNTIFPRYRTKYKDPAINVGIPLLQCRGAMKHCRTDTQGSDRKSQRHQDCLKSTLMSYDEFKKGKGRSGGGGRVGASGPLWVGTGSLKEDISSIMNLRGYCYRKVEFHIYARGTIEKMLCWTG